MANKVIHKRSIQKGLLPSGTTLDYGEIAVNYNSGEPFLSIRTTESGKTDTKYAKFIDEATIDAKIKNVKPLQDKVSDPTASTATTTTFIATISQDENGVIAATKKTLPTATTSKKGIVQLSDSVTSTGSSKAATEKAVKTAYDLADSKSEVAITQTITDGKEIAKLTIDETSTSLYIDTFGGATSSVAGKDGLVPAPATGDTGKYLKGNGQWTTVSYNDLSNRPTIPSSFTITAEAEDDDVIKLEGVNGSNKTTYKVSHEKMYDTSGTTAKYTSNNTTTSVSGYSASGTIKIPQITVDEYGHVTKAADESITITMPSAQDIPTKLPNPNSLTINVNGSEVAKYDGSSGVTANIANTAHSHSAGVGLVGSGNSGISGTYTYKVNIKDETKLTEDSTAADSGAVYPVALDKSGKLAVKVPIEQYKGTVTSVKISGSNGVSTSTSAITTSGTLTISGVTATSGTTGTGVAKLVTGDLKNKTYADGEAAAAAHTHTQYSETGHTHSYKPLQTAVSDPNASSDYSKTFISSISQNKNGVITATKNPVQLSNTLTFGSKTYDGSSAQTITAADLGLGAALKYCGITTTALTDGATTNPIKINNANHTATAGCVVFYGDKEFVFNGTNWELLGAETTYKVVQTAVSDPNASTETTTTFISNISQDKNGVISPTKKTLPTATSGATGTGMAKLVTGDLKGKTYTKGEAAAAAHTHSQYSETGHNHDNVYVSKQELEDNELVVAQAIAELNDKKSDTGHRHDGLYLKEHQRIYNLILSAGTFSATSFVPNGATKTVYIPTSTTHISNDSGYITSAATVNNANNLGGVAAANYATQQWVNNKNYITSAATVSQANQLATARTLWGQSFSGTANVSGAISSTGNITPSANATSTLGTASLKYKEVHVSNSVNVGSGAINYNATTGCMEIIC